MPTATLQRRVTPIWSLSCASWRICRRRRLPMRSSVAASEIHFHAHRHELAGNEATES
jgi:hypothetical protein